MLDLWLGRKIKRVCWRVCVGRERECQRMKQASVNRTCSTIIYLGQIMNFLDEKKYLSSVAGGREISRSLNF